MEFEGFNKLKYIILLQFIIMFYTLSGVMAKKASFTNFLSKEFIFYYALEIVILGIYAIMWQQIIKKFSISVAYANKGMAILWSLLWSMIFFNESITVNNIIGALIILLGIGMVNKNGE